MITIKVMLSQKTASTVKQKKTEKRDEYKNIKKKYSE